MKINLLHRCMQAAHLQRAEVNYLPSISYSMADFASMAVDQHISQENDIHSVPSPLLFISWGFVFDFHSRKFVDNFIDLNIVLKIECPTLESFSMKKLMCPPFNADRSFAVQLSKGTLESALGTFEALITQLVWVNSFSMAL